MPGVLYVDLSFEVSITVLKMIRFLSKPQHALECSYTFWKSTQEGSVKRMLPWWPQLPGSLSVSKKKKKSLSSAQSHKLEYELTHWDSLSSFSVEILRVAQSLPAGYCRLSHTSACHITAHSFPLRITKNKFSVFQDSLVIWTNINDYIHQMVKQNRRKVGKWSKFSLCFYTELITHATCLID